MTKTQGIDTDVQRAIDRVAAQAATLGHRLGVFTAEVHWQNDRQEVTIWVAGCSCRPDAEVFVRVTEKPPGGKRRITVHGAALERRHDELLAQPKV